jgi:hypothetical protein
MIPNQVQKEIDTLIEEFGENPMQFFWILHESPNENLDFQKQNEVWALIKAETWHSLDLSHYWLWAISDNGDLLWWNGDRTIAMHPRDGDFISEPGSPSQFIRLLVSGRSCSFFPDDLGGGSSNP